MKRTRINSPSIFIPAPALSSVLVLVFLIPSELKSLHHSHGFHQERLQLDQLQRRQIGDL